MIKKIIISILIVITIIGIGYILKDISITDSNASSDRIIRVFNQGDFEIYIDNVTKVMYLQSKKGIGYQGYGGLTVMVDTEGKPLLYEGE